MTKYIVVVDNQEAYDDYNESTLIVTASSEIKAREIINKWIMLQGLIHARDIRDSKSGYGMWSLFGPEYFYHGRIQSIAPINSCKQIFNPKWNKAYEKIIKGEITRIKKTNKFINTKEKRK